MLLKIYSHRILKVCFFCLYTIFHIKRIIGRKFNDSSVQQDIKTFPFSVIQDKGKPIVKVDIGYGEKLFTPEEISAIILGKMRDIAVSFLSLSQRKCRQSSVGYYRKDILVRK
jgi:molecular chaperone DnaK (HSP70)